MKRFLVVVSFMVSMALIISSCKKGCTNKSAINYNSSAKEDDASCFFCDSVIVDSADRSSIWFDNYPGIHYHDSLLYITNKVVLYNYSGNYCPVLGKKTSCDPRFGIQNFAYCIFKIKNIRPDTISITGYLGFSLFGNQTDSTYYLQNYVLPPDSELNFGSSIYFGCVSVNSATPNYHSNLEVTYY